MRHIILLVTEDQTVYFWNLNEKAFTSIVSMGCINHTIHQAAEQIKSPLFVKLHNWPQFRGQVTIVPTTL